MSTLRVDTLENAAGTGQPAMVGAAKAWVNFNGTGTVAIRRAFNVASITDNGTGNYYVNFTSAMSDANYVTNLSHGAYSSAAYRGWDIIFNQETTRARVETRNEAGNEIDAPLVCVTIFS